VVGLLAEATGLYQTSGLQAPEDLVHVLWHFQNGGVGTERALLKTLDASLEQLGHP